MAHTLNCSHTKYGGIALENFTWVSIHNGGGVGWGEVVNGSWYSS
jgi:urocanate hydratase